MLVLLRQLFTSLWPNVIDNTFDLETESNGLTVWMSLCMFGQVIYGYGPVCGRSRIDSYM